LSPRTADGLAWEAVGSGPAVLLIHAGIADRTMWDPQWERWSDRFALIRYDQRGFGESADPAPPYSLHGDALAVLDAAQAGRVAVIGGSMGGGAALDLVLAAPERVSALVVVGATPPGWAHLPDLVAAFDRVEAAYESGGIEAANAVELAIWADGSERRTDKVDPGFRARVAEMNLEALRREESREQAGNLIEPDPLEPPAVARLAEVRAPTLVVAGEHEQPSVLAGSAAMTREVPGAEAVQIAGAAHLPSLERPEAFDSAVVSFLARHAG
jgi:pimeloyl-ACP methyl ester carboxylesterase